MIDEKGRHQVEWFRNDSLILSHTSIDQDDDGKFDYQIFGFTAPSKQGKSLVLEVLGGQLSSLTANSRSTGFSMLDHDSDGTIDLLAIYSDDINVFELFIIQEHFSVQPVESSVLEAAKNTPRDWQAIVAAALEKEP